MKTFDALLKEKLENPEYKKEWDRLQAGGPCVDCGKHTKSVCEECEVFCCDACLTAVYTQPEVDPLDDFLDGTFCKKCTAKYGASIVKEVYL